MEIKVKSLTGIFPEYETEGSAGMDIRAHLENPMEIKPGEKSARTYRTFSGNPKGL